MRTTRRQLRKERGLETTLEDINLTDEEFMLEYDVYFDEEEE